MKIYTRTGDSGDTALIGGQRVPKSHPRLDAYGTLDELNSILGILRLHTSSQTMGDDILRLIQKDLFVVGAILANPASNLSEAVSLLFAPEKMEEDIDRLTALAPALKTFILPAGCLATANAHHARTVCRRAERLAASLFASSEAPQWVVAYLNRLSDWLFALARAENAVAGITEETL
ncbi:MAG: cob(I)yrinic acid a,c-diamide adenosyltransferase [Holophagaceae bacterium]|nr:cob(I)yrinic acid a,c-diamide adenosyltransferase [Holophagaceae bacterium]